MQTILLTGGAGFVGSHTADALLKKDHKVVCVDNFNDYYDPSRKRENIAHHLDNDRFALEEADITDYDAMQSIFEKHHPSHVVHLAARAGVRPSLNDPFIYQRVNVQGTLNLLELSKDVKKFVYGSSSSVYGKNAKIPFSEDDRTDFPISPYAATKKAGEILTHTYHSLYDIPVVCLRFFTVYGPRGRPDMAPYLFTKWIHEGQPISMFGDGTSKRDYTYVADIVQGIISALEADLSYEIINLGNSDPIELREFIGVIEEKLGKKAIIEQKPMPPGDVPITYADITKAKKLLGYCPSTDIHEGMASFIEWFRTVQ